MNFLNEPYFVLFVIFALGLLLGNIKIGGISLDSSAVIFAALLFGHFGFKVPDIIKEVGLILFIYSVGIQAGPGFFDAFKRQGKTMIVVALTIVLTGALLSIGFAFVVPLPFDMAAGLFTGALTSTPGLAAAIEATGSNMASIGYSVSYLFGTIGVILFVRIAHKIIRVDIRQEEEAYEKMLHQEHPQLFNRNFIIENPNLFGKSIEEIRFRSVTGTNISRVLHQEKAFTPEKTTILHEGDVIKAVGTEANLEKTALFAGSQTEKKIPLSSKFVVKPLLVTNKNVVNKSLAELGLFSNYNATVTSIRRSGIDITPNPGSKLHFGDKVMIATTDDALEKITEILGNSRKQFINLNFLPVSIGVILGILLGHINFPLFGLNLKLGLTGGVVVSALILSKIGKTGGLLWNVSGESNQLLRKIGLLFFLSAVGTESGEHFLETVQTAGMELFLMGMVITLVPMFVTLIVGKYVLKMNYLVLIGTLIGSMTSTPALAAVEPVTKSNAPQVAYATVYPFALVLLIIVSKLFGVF
jgi:putative transport protein